MNCLIQQLQIILRWMKRQERFNFYCSSLLIVYDGELLKDHSSTMYFQQNGLNSNPCQHFLTTALAGRQDAGLHTRQNEEDREIEANYKDYLRSHSNCFLPLATNGSELVQVKIIDLAHTVDTSAVGTSNMISLSSVNIDNTLGPSTLSPRLDVGYIHGLETLIGMMEELMLIADNAGSQKSNIVDNISNVFACELLETIRPV